MTPSSAIEKMAFPGVLLSPLPEHRRVAPFVPRPGDVLGCVLAFFFTAFFEGNENERGIKCYFGAFVVFHVGG